MIAGPGRTRNSRRPRRRRGRSRPRAVLALAVLGLALIGVASLADPAPWLVWNGSRSAPVGLYRVASVAPLRVGDLVLVRTPARVRELAAMRGYLPATVPLVKRVAASDGDAVCTRGTDIFVNGRRVAARRARDRLGRSLPWWSGCRALDGEVFLLMGDVAASFDGRYFGPVPRDAVIGRLVPLWTE